MAKSWDSLKKRLILAFKPHGSISAFCRKTGLARSGVDKWFDPNNPTSPNLESLDVISDAINLKPWDAIKPEGEPLEAHTLLDCAKALGRASYNIDIPVFWRLEEPVRFLILGLIDSLSNLEFSEQKQTLAGWEYCLKVSNKKQLILLIQAFLKLPDDVKERALIRMEALALQKTASQKNNKKTIK